ncbi:MAG: hypothetical protein EWV41_04135 [Microcystis wesenbergii Mw_MB_S_20031200_S109]|uniref:Uncharacterized protein n=1 Tax=Microcystis wesenbergii Mw_MB_S_20031200_S109D TaxID=2486241 RepID=A0A552LXJ0_9CHRO|nr:MAG: hypothetical protein EWV41_04135 [Microcystis wesenbergii Mw_MB_S_20031200_S109]TRV24931.1 MAG: hypothetical protein EWV88_08725 [Microcystis wesenbergii Mw_MB_S_20031200_S109D]
MPFFFIRGEHLSPRVRASQLGLTKGSQHSNHIVIIHGRLFTLMTKAVAGANPTGIFQLSRAIIFWVRRGTNFSVTCNEKGRWRFY